MFEMCLYHIGNIKNTPLYGGQYYKIYILGAYFGHFKDYILIAISEVTHFLLIKYV